ncbi:uncharacterized protein ARMOST_17803 [Armillaria ostoyae]|uniref:Uncharacterized protein n=1 Tax=Armillaria ostoyae TaxID=47428 RepID=A0A284S043_ARMOS|nr:uncharacterized protein ARMOST_17803 [Armillaria ostoyae]
MTRHQEDGVGGTRACEGQDSASCYDCIHNGSYQEARLIHMYSLSSFRMLWAANPQYKDVEVIAPALHPSLPPFLS